MKHLGKVVGTSAIAAVACAFAVYVATPHFGEAKSLIVSTLSVPAVWWSVVALWAGFFCLQRWWDRLQFRSYDAYGNGGWWSLAWFLAGVGLSLEGAYTIFSIARPLVR